jgi:hypothetical protein
VEAVRRRNACLVALVSGSALVAGSPSLSAERGETVALVAADGELIRATSAALAAWPVAVINVEAPGPGATMPGAAGAAATIAREHSARAVVWTSADADLSTLWVYDVSTGRALAQQLPARPPFDEPTAAAIALTIKTLLRYGETAPADERYAVPARPARIAIEARSTGSFRSGADQAWEPRFALTVFYRPRRLDRLRLGVGARGGPGLEVEAPDFVGHYSDSAVAATAGIEIALGRRLSLVPSIGATLHFAHLTGTSLSRSESGNQWYVNPAADAGLQLELQLVGRLRVAVLAELAAPLRRQRFLVGTDEVFDVPAIGVDVGAAVQVPLF